MNLKKIHRQIRITKEKIHRRLIKGYLRNKPEASVYEIDEFLHCIGGIGMENTSKEEIRKLVEEIRNELEKTD